jgi:hypothetical protein
MGSQLDPLPLFRVGSRERAAKSQFPQLDFGKPLSGFHPVTWERVINGFIRNQFHSFKGIVSAYMLNFRLNSLIYEACTTSFDHIILPSV